MTDKLFTYIARCRKESECLLADGSRANAICFKVADRYAYECPNCGRQYRADDAWQYRDEVWNG